MGNDTIKKTLLIAGLLSLVCSAFVSSSAVFLRPNQARNKDLDRKKNILLAAGLYEEGKSVEELFQKFEVRIVELASGQYEESLDATTFDQRKAARSTELGLDVSGKKGLAGIKRKSRYAPVFVSRDDQGTLQQLVLPVHGKGLWSTMYGFLALENDLSTIKGFAFYEHGETPGLGGEVDNPDWKAQWVGKKAFDKSGQIGIKVLKGKVVPNSPNAQFEADGLSGATITTRGIDALLQYWLGAEGFKPFLTQFRKEEGV